MDLPTGTVTFLFTNIEGSTELWEQDQASARKVLVRHDELIEDLKEESSPPFCTTHSSTIPPYGFATAFARRPRPCAPSLSRSLIPIDTVPRGRLGQVRMSMM